MKTKIIIVAVAIAFLSLFSFASYKAYKKVKQIIYGMTHPRETLLEPVKNLPEQKQIGVEHYIWNRKYYTVRKFAPEVNSKEAHIIEYNEYLNDMIEIALQESQKYEKYIPQEYQKFSQEKYDELQKKIDERNQKKLESMSDEWKKVAEKMQDAAESIKEILPEDENITFSAFYDYLKTLENDKKNNDVDYSLDRKLAYDAKVKYYGEIITKNRFLTMMNSDHFIMAAMRKIYMDPSGTPTDIGWKNRIIVPGVKKTIQLQPSGFLVPDVIYERFEKIKIPFDIYDKNTQVKTYAQKEIPQMKYMEYYSSTENMEEEDGWELFFFRFDNDFPLFYKYDNYNNFSYILTVIRDIMKKSKNLSYFDNTMDETPEQHYGPDGEKRITIGYEGKVKNSKKYFTGSGYAISKENKVWVLLDSIRTSGDIKEDADEENTAPRTQISEEELMTADWYHADNTDLVITIEGMDMNEFKPEYM